LNTTEFIALLQQPSKLTASQTRALEAIVEEFPYMQSARAMQLKGLKDSESFSYNKELKTTAAHTVDRSVLFEYITSEEFSQNEIANTLQSRDDYLRNITVFEPEEVITKKSVAIDDAIKMKLKEAHQVFDEDLFELPAKPLKTAPKEENLSADEAVKVNKASEDEIKEKLQIGKPLEFDKSESHSFSEWLQLTAVKPIDRSSKTLENPVSDSKIGNRAESDEKAKKFELIDNFIASNPKIVPKKTPLNANFLKDNEVPQESLMTATLARVYLEQKNYKKAIQAYKILILKNPEKSSFFADQIREIETLIEKQ